jgi:hypothetical protein
MGTAQSAHEIILLAFEADERNQKLAEQYAFREHVEERKLDKQGEVKRTESTTYDVAHLCGRNYQRVIARDGQPLSAKEDFKESQKLDRCIEKLNAESPDRRLKRLRKEEEELDDQRKLRREVLNAFNFTIEGDEELHGAATWRIRVEPKADYEPAFKKAAFLSKLAGVIWISKADYGWVKTEVETIAPAKFGLFLLTLKQGAHMEFSQTKVNDELWMMNQLRLRFNARVLLAGLRREILVDWSEFKKFTSDSKLIVE